ncbi:M23 family metallopeptidase [Sporosarcina obsidiansis]|uniref:M23 family metallopeptidase n=1 Tax=Sporosarcina obsidiansis TaxID=2660748 RepID=UPI001E2D979F|nr:M23 family metallopeptidase [Sporosarcina obsidiansis]
MKNGWFWPAIYTSVALLFIGMVWGYSALTKDETTKSEVAKIDQPKDSVTVETNAEKETLKYPFNEDQLEQVAILQEFYDPQAEESMREKALLVFKQSYVTSTGLAISIDGQPFEVAAAMSGTVEEVIVDSFKGSEIKIKHADGKTTVYGSLTGVLVKEGDEIQQGQIIASATQNEWNPAAGVHLQFEVQEEGVAVNPRNYLAF